MKYVFGRRSLTTLGEAHPLLQQVAYAALERGEIDFAVICSYRGRREQERAFREGKTKARFGQSAHNYEPALAIDVMPWPNGFKANMEEWKLLGKIFLEEAARLGIALRWGGDFNRDGDKTTKDAWDSPHFELHPWRDYMQK